MKKPIPSPCDGCPVRATCKGFCKKWEEWLFSPESESKHKQLTLGQWVHQGFDPVPKEREQ